MIYKGAQSLLPPLKICVDVEVSIVSLNGRVVDGNSAANLVKIFFSKFIAKPVKYKEVK